MHELRRAAGQALLAFLVLWPFDPTAGLGLALVVWVGTAARKRGRNLERVPIRTAHLFVKDFDLREEPRRGCECFE